MFDLHVIIVSLCQFINDINIIIVYRYIPGMLT